MEVANNKSFKVYALVKEHDRHLHVATLTEKEIDDQGITGLEMLCKEYCDKHKLTFVDFAT
jgi:hypothetical protein